MVWYSSMHNGPLAVNLLYLPMKSTGMTWPMNSTTCGKHTTIEKCSFGGGG